MDDKTKAFLELVKCDPSEVRDVPKDRLHCCPSQPGSAARKLLPEKRRASLGKKSLYFGKHRGKRLKDVPEDYLRWALKQMAENGSFRRFQRDAREYLGNRR